MDETPEWSVQPPQVRPLINAGDVIEIGTRTNVCRYTVRCVSGGSNGRPIQLTVDLAD